MLWYESLILPDQGQRAAAAAAEMRFKTFKAKVFAYIEVLEERRPLSLVVRWKLKPARHSHQFS